MNQIFGNEDVYDSFDENESNEKWEFIDSWLKSHFKDKSIPLFERNREVASALYELALFNKQQDAMTEIIINRQKIQTVEYRAEAKRIKDILDIVELSKVDLSKNGTQALKTLSSLATVLALAQLNLNTLRVERKNNVILRSTESMETQIQTAKLRNEKLNTLLSNLRCRWNSKGQQKLQEWKKNTLLLSEKGKEYQSRLSILERKYNDMNVKEGGLRFKDLKEKENNVNALDHEIRSKTSKLKIYKIMPPNMTLAKLQLDEAKLKLDELKETRDELIYNMAGNFQ
ncbi:3043_t:CDS:2 [Funneliformis geosporum]|nr:3043_t:CDS:2 [Funneliformis geosporum]